MAAHVSKSDPHLDAKIDDLYQQPLDAFTGARNALAKTLSGPGAAEVRKLVKPTVVPWAVNQLYWRARHVFERMRKSGERLRTAQIAALNGRATDLRGASAAHREVIADAAAQALRLAEAAGSHPGADELTRTLEALSLAPDLTEPPGRLTRSLQPAGFEALTGIPVAPPPHAPPPDVETPGKPHARAQDTREERKREKENEKREKEAARRAEAAIATAEAMRDRAAAAEAKARTEWERAKRDLEGANQALEEARAGRRQPGD